MKFQSSALKSAPCLSRMPARPDQLAYAKALLRTHRVLIDLLKSVSKE